jgi:hypothetical protein
MMALMYLYSYINEQFTMYHFNQSDGAVLNDSDIDIYNESETSEKNREDEDEMRARNAILRDY